MATFVLMDFTVEKSMLLNSDCNSYQSDFDKKLIDRSRVLEELISKDYHVRFTT